MGMFGNSPITSPFPQKENVIRYSKIIPKKKHSGTLTVVKMIREVVYLYRFSIFMHISFIHVDTETFVPMNCTYTLTL